MFDSVEEVIECLKTMLVTLEELDRDGQYHVAIELGHQFQEELEEAHNEG